MKQKLEKYKNLYTIINKSLSDANEGIATLKEQNNKFSMLAENQKNSIEHERKKNLEFQILGNRLIQN